MSGLDTTRLRTMMAPYAPSRLKLGRHREAERLPEGLALKFHNQPVILLEDGRITLDLCGQWSPSTVRAIGDYLTALKLPIKASLAGGEFSARYKGRLHKPSWSNKIVIQLD